MMVPNPTLVPETPQLLEANDLEPDLAPSSGGGGPAPKGFEASYAFHIIALANHLSSGSSALYLELFGIGGTEGRVLRVVAFEPGESASRICQITSMDKSVISRALARLASLGLVVGASDPEDSRRTLWSVTERGGELSAKVSQVAHERQERLLAGFSPLERMATLDALKRMMANAPLANSYRPPDKG